MIELIDAGRCTGCNICVEVCPTRVFDKAARDGLPAIARQSDCQTCFMCELYCPEDALYVSPQTAALPAVSLPALADAAPWGSYRRSVGWHERGASTAGADQSYHLLNMR